MPWCNTPEIFFSAYGAAHSHAQEPTPGSAVEFWGESVRKNRPLVPRSNIAGSWAWGGAGGTCCFRISWNHGTWQFLFLVVHEDQVFPVIWCWGWYFRDIDCCPATPLHPFLSFGVADWGFN